MRKKSGNEVPRFRCRCLSETKKLWGTRILFIAFAFSLLLTISYGCGASERTYRIRTGGETVSMTLKEIRSGYRSGRLTKRTPIFYRKRWIPLEEWPELGRGISGENGAETQVNIPPVLVLNADSPGAEVVLENFVVKGRTTIFDFYSRYCGPCVQIAPYLEKFATQNRDYVVRKIDINRRGYTGIDWNSPVARQHSLESIPHFVIFGPDGRKRWEGAEAYERVLGWLEQEIEPGK
ncbi:MAG: thioredoxin [Candidatus Hydrogenedentota bacterium]|nr:MAG: thioredoxin [Candidatus Hydrogenedentota bacterium]